ncbi:MAG: hypothetical protein RIC06_00800 [Cyclobacteriaceae bacterium]
MAGGQEKLKSLGEAKRLREVRVRPGVRVGANRPNVGMSEYLSEDNFTLQSSSISTISQTPSICINITR